MAKPLTLGSLVRGTGSLVRGAIETVRIAQSLVPPSAPPVPTTPPLDPMAGLAAGDELTRYAMRDGAFFVGRVHEDHGVNFPAGVADDRHIFIVAGNRAGKGLSFGIPNALTWPGPLFAIDPKGEMASIAALRRASVSEAKGTGTSVRSFLGQRVAILDPLGEVRGPARAFRVSYNPLADIDMSAGGGVRAIRAVASSIIHPEEGNAAHFSETAETVLAGVIEAMKRNEPPERQTLTQCRALMLAGFKALNAYLMSVDTAAGLAQEAVMLMEQIGDDEWGSHTATLSRNLKWLAEPDMQTHLAPSAFSLRDAVQSGWSVFVSLPPGAIDDFKSWLRLIVRTVIDAKMRLGTNQKGSQTLCLLDEFPALGRFNVIEHSAGYMAGYGLKLVPIIQNIGQVQQLYARNWETFLGNAGAIIAFGLNDLASEQYISDRLGRHMVAETSRSTSSGTNSQFMGGSSSASESYSTGLHERPVRFAKEIHEQGARETMRAFVIPASGRGFTVRRTNYTDFPAGLYDAPDFITQWEAQNFSRKG